MKIKNADKTDKLESALRELSKVHVIDKNLPEIINEILVDYESEFEMVGREKIADQSHESHIRFRKLDDYEAYIDAIDQDYESEDAISNGYIYKIITPQFNLVNTSKNGNACDFKHKFIEYRDKNCFIPTKAYCLVKCINFITGEDCKQQYLDFFRNGKQTSKYYD